MSHEDALELIKVLRSIEGWGWFVCLWIFINGLMR